jgi:hypothetical protein
VVVCLLAGIIECLISQAREKALQTSSIKEVDQESYKAPLYLSRVVRYLLSKTERAYVENKDQFTKDKQRLIRYRLNKKLKEKRDAASEFRDGVELITTTRTFRHAISSSNNIIISNSDSNIERGSPRPAVRAGSNLVGRGIANPMSERTRGFELPSKDGTKVPLPALPPTILPNSNL